MDDAKERIEELLLTCVSETYNLKPGTAERQREVNNIATLTELRIKAETEERKLELEERKLINDQDQNDIDQMKYKDENQLKLKEIEEACKDSRRRLISDITKVILVGVAVPVLMMVDEHSGDLLNNRIFRFWSRPKI